MPCRRPARPQQEVRGERGHAPSRRGTAGKASAPGSSVCLMPAAGNALRAALARGSAAGWSDFSSAALIVAVPPHVREGVDHLCSTIPHRSAHLSLHAVPPGLLEKLRQQPLHAPAGVRSPDRREGGKGSTIDSLLTDSDQCSLPHPAVFAKILVPPANVLHAGYRSFLPLPFDGPLRAGRGVLTWGCRPPQNAPLHPPLLPLPKHGAPTGGDKEALESDGARGGVDR